LKTILELFKANYNNEKVCDLIESLEKLGYFRSSIIEDLKQYLITNEEIKSPLFTMKEQQAVIITIQENEK